MLFALVGAIFAASFEDGLRAFENGEYEKTVKIFSRLCEEGDAQACFNTAHMYATGSGVKQSFKSAVTLYKRACEAGSYQGCWFLGVAYEHGDGVKIDAARADELKNMACRMQGGAELCVELGDAHYASEQIADALGLYKIACEAKSGTGCRNAGQILEHVLQRDPSDVLRLYAKGCELSDAWACFSAGTIYYNGELAPKDTNRALEYFTKSCELGEENGCDIAKGLQNHSFIDKILDKFSR